MPSYLDSFITAEMRALVEKRVMEQLDRHRSIDPNIEPKKIVELTIRMMKESQQKKLDKLLESDESGSSDEERIISLRNLINEVLPELERRIKKSY